MIELKEFEELNRMSKGELKQYIKERAKIANKNLYDLEQRDLTDSQSYQNRDGRRFRYGYNNRNILLQEANNVNRFLDNQTRTATGYKKYLKEHVARIKGNEDFKKEFLNNSNFRKKYFEKYEKYKERNPGGNSNEIMKSLSNHIEEVLLNEDTTDLFKDIDKELEEEFNEFDNYSYLK